MNKTYDEIMNEIKTQVITNKSGFYTQLRIINEITMKSLTKLLKSIIPTQLEYEIKPSYTRLENILKKIGLYQKKTPNSMSDCWLEWDDEMASFQFGIQKIRDNYLKGKKLNKRWNAFQKTLSRLHKQISLIENLQPSTCVNVLLKSRIRIEKKWVREHRS